MRTRYAVLLVAVLTLAAAAPNAAARPKSIPAAAAFTLPSTKACVAGHKLTLLLRKVPRVRWTGATVKVNGRKVKTVRASQTNQPIRITGLPSGTYTLTITARARGGRTAKASRTYRACGPIVQPTPTPTPTATPTPTPAPAAGSAQPGSYSGASNSRLLTFFVSPDGTHVQDVTVPTGLGCVPSRSALSDRFVVSDIAIAPDGSFTSTTSQTGVWADASATFTYVFSGHFTATGATGTLRETIAFDNGVAYTCTTNDQTWTVTRDAQGTQTASAPPAGSYTGASNSRALTLFVANDQKSLQDVTVPTGLNCAPTFSPPTLSDRFVISSVPLAADGSFDVTTTQDGVWGDVPARFTYVFRGHVHSVDSNGTERLAGVLRETIAFTNGTAFSCTTDDQYWYALRDAQGTQTGTPAAGSYSGASNSRLLTFTVSADKQHIQTVSVPTALSCTPAHSALSDHLTIADVPVAADGSFGTTTAPVAGTIAGAPATFTYTFRGHVHGLGFDGKTRFAGVLREDIAFNDGTAYSCTTNDQYWSATN